MKDDPNTNTQIIVTLLQDVADYIAQADENVREGKHIELDDLGPKVEELCTRILSLEQPVGREYADTLAHLCDALKALKVNIDQAKHQLVKERNTLQKRQKAAKTYGKAQQPN